MSVRDLIPWGRQENRAPTLYREDSRDPFTTLRREMDRLFDDTFRSFGLTAFGRGAAWPSVEVSETDSEVRVTAEVPGLAEKDIELTLDNGLLTLRGERKSETEDKDRGYSERFYGRFERRIALPTSVDEEKANARFDNGVLTVTLPKSPEAERGRRIPINGETKH
jgi:HSP20 family protein